MKKVREVKVNYKRLRLKLLRENLECFFSLLVKPDRKQAIRYRQLRKDYADLTDQAAIDTPFTPAQFLIIEPPHLQREKWLRLLHSVQEADAKLGERFYDRYLAISPLKGQVLFFFPDRSETDERLDFQVLRHTHQISPIVEPTFVQRIRNATVVAFPQEVVGKQSAA